MATGKLDVLPSSQWKKKDHRWPNKCQLGIPQAPNSLLDNSTTQWRESLISDILMWVIHKALTVERKIKLTREYEYSFRFWNKASKVVCESLISYVLIKLWASLGYLWLRWDIIFLCEKKNIYSLNFVYWYCKRFMDPSERIKSTFPTMSVVLSLVFLFGLFCF